jgi:4-hydroxybenzoate polyprenyltransferase
MKDDQKARIKSMAVGLGQGIRPALSLFDAAFIVCLLYAGYLDSQRFPFYVISIIAPSLLSLWHIVI